MQSILGRLESGEKEIFQIQDTYNLEHFYSQTNVFAQESSRPVGSCSNGWEYDTENYHRLLSPYRLEIIAVEC